jgi:hypothetical protein
MFQLAPLFNFSAAAVSVTVAHRVAVLALVQLANELGAMGVHMELAELGLRALHDATR